MADNWAKAFSKTPKEKAKREQEQLNDRIRPNEFKSTIYEEA